MKNLLRERLDQLLENSTRREIALARAVILAFSTTYSLVRPAITLEKGTAETMSGMSLSDNGQQGNTSTSSSEEDSGDSETVSFDAETKNKAGKTEALVHVEADAVSVGRF